MSIRFQLTANSTYYIESPEGPFTVYIGKL